MNKKEVIAKIKVCFIRSSSYMSIANFAMILFMFTATLFPGLSTKARIILTIIGFFGALFIGYLDIKLKIMNEEQNYIVSKNDVIMGFIKKMDRIEDKLDEVIER